MVINIANQLSLTISIDSHVDDYRSGLNKLGRYKFSFTNCGDKDVGSATHYHAQYVAPYWAPTLVKMTQVGQLIF